jgi:hypothetical protein
MPIGVNAAVKASKPSTPNPVRNPPIPEPGIDQLRARDHSPLPFGQLRQGGLVDFPFHLARKSTNPEISPSFSAAVYAGVAETRVVCADP